MLRYSCSRSLLVLSLLALSAACGDGGPDQDAPFDGFIEHAPDHLGNQNAVDLANELAADAGVEGDGGFEGDARDAFQGFIDSAPPPLGNRPSVKLANELAEQAAEDAQEEDEDLED